ncbi:MAG: T9SS type A sorting domain-containing protein [Bacteroidota bacterium]
MKHVLLFLCLIGSVQLSFSQNQRARYRLFYEWDSDNFEWRLSQNQYIQTNTKARTIDYFGQTFDETSPIPGTRFVLRSTYYEPDSTQLQSQEVESSYEVNGVSVYLRSLREFDQEGQLIRQCNWQEILDPAFSDEPDLYFACQSYAYNDQGDLLQTADTVKDPLSGDVININTTDYDNVYDDNGCKIAEKNFSSNSFNTRKEFTVTEDCTVLQEITQRFDPAQQKFVNQTLKVNAQVGDTLFAYYSNWNEAEQRWDSVTREEGIVEISGIPYLVYIRDKTSASGFDTRFYYRYSLSGTYLGFTEERKSPDTGEWYVQNRLDEVYIFGRLTRTESYQNYTLEWEKFNSIDTVFYTYDAQNRLIRKETKSYILDFGTGEYFESFLLPEIYEYENYCLNILKSVTTYEGDRLKSREIYFYDQNYIAVCEQADQPVVQAEVFPNPVRDRLHIRTEVWNLEEVQLEVFDYMGKRVKYEILERGPYFLDLYVGNLKEGHYLLRFSFGDDVMTQKIRVAKE